MKTQKSKIARNEWVRQQRLAGRSIKSIADELGLSPGAVAFICKKVNCEGVMVPLEAWQKHTREAAKETGKRKLKTTAQINEELRPFGFEYVSGYSGCDSLVTIRCLTCGAEIERYYNFTRAAHNSSCPECKRREKERQRETERAERQRQAELRGIAKSKQLKLHLATCECCGRLFVPGVRRRYCSDECARKAYNRKKDRRLNSQNVIDKDITLEKLYNRDFGVCYICGKKCDWQDFSIVEGVTICGDDYPSIEHIVPISKGGKHSWINVKLACRRCNLIKRDSPASNF